MKAIKDLFEGREPFVKTFYEKISLLPQEEKEKYMEMAYLWIWQDWRRINKTYRKFLINLIESDRQKFLDFLLKHTVLGALRYEPEEPETLLKVIDLSEGAIRERKGSVPHLAFSLSLCFAYPQKISTLCNKLRHQHFTPEEVLDLFERATITTVP